MFKKLITVCFIVALSGCQSAYYSAMEKVGVHKREILLDRVDTARESQQDAQQQFKDALEHFRSVTQFDGGELEALYDRLSGEYERSLAAAEDVSNRIDKVESVAEALFDEWQQELSQYSKASFKAQSAKQLAQTKRRYSQLIKSMKRAEKRMKPVLTAFNDNVLYLKHNLNARAIGALKGELGSIRQQVDVLVKDMQSAIDESEQFIDTLQKQ